MRSPGSSPLVLAFLLMPLSTQAQVPQGGVDGGIGSGGYGGLRDARDDGDREGMRAAFRHHGPDVRRLWKDLSNRDEAFDKSTKEILTKDQRKKLEQWQDQQEKERADERRARRQGLGGPGEPAD